MFERPSPQFFWKVVQLTVSFGYTGVLFQITPDLLVVTVNQCLHRFYEPDAAIERCIENSWVHSQFLGHGRVQSVFFVAASSLLYIVI